MYILVNKYLQDEFSNIDWVVFILMCNKIPYYFPKNILFP